MKIEDLQGKELSVADFEIRVASLTETQAKNLLIEFYKALIMQVEEIPQIVIPLEDCIG